MKPTYLGFEGPRNRDGKPISIDFLGYCPVDVCGHYYVPAENKLTAVMYLSKQFDLSFIICYFLFLCIKCTELSISICLYIDLSYALFIKQ